MTRRRLIALGSALLAVPVALSSCSASPITTARVDKAVGVAFERLYLNQQQTLGKAVVSTPDGAATCTRGSASSPHRGAGDDWSCVVRYPFADGHIQPIIYDVKVDATGCYKAAGPAAVVGPQHINGADGRTITNPLFEFDGCFYTG